MARSNSFFTIVPGGVIKHTSDRRRPSCAREPSRRLHPIIPIPIVAEDHIALQFNINIPTVRPVTTPKGQTPPSTSFEYNGTQMVSILQYPSDLERSTCTGSSTRSRGSPRSSRPTDYLSPRIQTRQLCVSPGDIVTTADARTCSFILF